MPLLQYVEPGGEIYLPFAKKKLAQWKAEMLVSGHPTFARVIFVTDGSTIYINSVYRGHGIFFDRIRITSGSSHGYVLYFSGVAEVPVAARAAIVPMTGDRALRVFPVGYDMDTIGRSTQSGGVKDPVLTYANLLSPSTHGAFVDGKFVAGFNAGALQGAFQSAYTLNGVAAKTKLYVQSTGGIAEFLTGTPLTRGGPDAATSISAARFQVNKPGTGLALGDILASTVTHVITDNRFTILVDYAAAPQLTVARYVAAPYDGVRYGVRTFGNDGTLPSVLVVACTAGSPDSSVFDATTVATTTEVSRFPGIVGVDDANANAYIDFLVDDVGKNDTIVEHDTANSSGGGSNTSSIDRTSAPVHTLGFRLPDGTTKTFDTERWTSTGSETSTSAVGAYTADSSVSASGMAGAVGVLYADPTMPIVFYVHVKLVLESVTGSGTSYSAAVPGPATTFTSSYTYHYERTVGVLTDEVDRVLFTEVSASATFAPGVRAATPNMSTGQFLGPLNFTPTKAGFPGCPDIVLPACNAPAISGITGACGTTTGTIPAPDPAVDVTVHDALKQNTRSRGYGRLFSAKTSSQGSIDVINSLDQTPSGHNSTFRGFLQIPSGTNDHRYFIDVKDKENWILVVHKVQDINGATINEDHYYAGTLNEATLKENVRAYLIASSTDDAFKAAMAGADLGVYPLEFYRSSTDVRLPMV